jgi:hypothetical protein
VPALEMITEQMPEQFVAKPAPADNGDPGISNFTDHWILKSILRLSFGFFR